MTSALELESLIYNTLSANLGCKVFNHVPENIFPPFIRIGEITVNNWLILPQSSTISITISAFSELASNLEVLNLIEKTKLILLQNLIPKIHPFIINSSVIGSNIFQLSNKIWVAEMQLEINFLKEQ